jgi:putative PIN family toxin of toxin-antitoxin system
MKKVVLDTNILVSALWTPSGNPARILAMMPGGQIVPCYNHEIMIEYRTVLERPKLKFSSVKTEAILRELMHYGFSVVVGASAGPFRDESDRKFYDVAKACDAFLITGNKKHYPNAAFILTPLEFLSTAR